MLTVLGGWPHFNRSTRRGGFRYTWASCPLAPAGAACRTHIHLLYRITVCICLARAATQKPKKKLLFDNKACDDPHWTLFGNLQEKKTVLLLARG